MKAVFLETIHVWCYLRLTGSQALNHNMKNIHVNFNFYVICNSFLHNNNFSHIQTKLIEEADKKTNACLVYFLSAWKERAQWAFSTQTVVTN